MELPHNREDNTLPIYDNLWNNVYNIRIGYTFWSFGHRGQIRMQGNVSGYYYQWCVLPPQNNGKNLLLEITHTYVLEHVEVDTLPSLISVHSADRYKESKEK